MFFKNDRTNYIKAVVKRLEQRYSGRDCVVKANFQSGRVSVMVGTRAVYRVQVLWLNTRGGIMPKFDNWLRINDYVAVGGKMAPYYVQRVRNNRCGGFASFCSIQYKGK